MDVTYEAIRLWWNRFGLKYAARLKRKHCGYGDSFSIDEVFVRIDGKQHYLWWVVDQGGAVVDVFLQKHRDGAAAKRFFKRLLKAHRAEPWKTVTDKLRSYGVAHWELIDDATHDSSQYANNRVELSHQPTRVRERWMRKFKSVAQAQRFSGVHSTAYSLFSLIRHLTSENHYRLFGMRALASWKSAVVWKDKYGVFFFDWIS